MRKFGSYHRLSSAVFTMAYYIRTFSTHTHTQQLMYPYIKPKIFAILFEMPAFSCGHCWQHSIFAAHHMQCTYKSITYKIQACVRMRSDTNYKNTLRARARCHFLKFKFRVFDGYSIYIYAVSCVVFVFVCVRVFTLAMVIEKNKWNYPVWHLTVQLNTWWICTHINSPILCECCQWMMSA